MREFFRRFFVFFLTICFFIVYPFSAFAEESQNTDNVEYLQRASLWHWWYSDPNRLSPFYAITAYTFGFVCPETDDGYHRASSYLKEGIDIDGLPYFSCICDYCGQEFTAHEVDLKQSYESQVSELPATEITSVSYTHLTLPTN